MWHEARKQERKIRVMMVDYQKRADRRRQYYEQIKLDPTQFMRVYGRPAKIHLDSAVAMAAEGPQIMQPWQGNSDIMIDRYDVRTHMDYIPEVQSSTQVSVSSDEEESRCCYERYRILVQNECAGVSEEQCLNQIFLDEQFGAMDNPVAKKAEEDKKRLAEKKAAIGYVYEDSTPADPDNEDEDSSDDEIDLDNILDIDALTEEQEEVLNTLSLGYGMKGMDYAECLQVDRDEVEALRQARQLEEEKAQYSGRKSRRERRAFKEKRMKNRPPSPPSYAAKEAPKKTALIKALSSSRSRSKSPAIPSSGVVEFITSFGGDSDNEGAVHGPTLPPQQMRKKVSSSLRSYRSRSRERSSDRQRKSSSHSRTDSKSSQLSSLRDSRTSLQRRSRSRSGDSRSRRRGERSRSRGERSRSRGERSRSRDYSHTDRDRYRDRSGQHDYGSFYSSQKSYGRRTSDDRDRDDDRYSRSRRSRSGGQKHSTSRSGRRNSRSWSRSRSRSRSASKQRGRLAGSRSRSSSSSPPENRVPSPPPLKSYRRPSLSSKSSSDFSSDDESATKSSSTGHFSKDNADDRSQDATSSKYEMNKSLLGKVEYTSAKNTLTPQERLKRKMQIVLNRQLKADKRAQKEKEVKEEQIRQDREEELRIIAMQMRQRERERRHREREREDSELRDRSGRYDDDDDDDDRPARYRRRSSSRSRSPALSASSRSNREKRRRSRSGSPRAPRLVDY